MSNNLPDFMFATGTRVMRTAGSLRQVTLEDARAAAESAGTAVVGLIPFDPNAPAHLFVPERLQIDDIPVPEHEVTLAEPTQIEGRENPGYRQAVATAVERMKAHQLDKVVLSRLLRADYAPGALDLAGVYNNLRAQQPNTFVFSVKLPQNHRGLEHPYLMGASPELIFSTEPDTGEGSVFKTHPLAGSAPRIAEHGSAEDEALGQRLMASRKDRGEHATVIADIRAQLEPMTRQLTIPEAPSLLQTPQLWHLGTPISGVLKQGMTCLDGARAIHPTPAICGAPTEAARRMIAELEPFSRDYFGGLVGYMNADGSGQWALVLRCAEVDAQTAILYAGAGIVAESDPALEHTETGTKLGSFGRALGINTLPQAVPADA
ncbi:isochorismate synthase [Rothia dentocariosa]|uniref:isochorismate synthase n=1 Tax=Rothia dentocariosa TaxID=2047 RepID=UPI001C55A350|nr:isochorismate synthase [Rothia dentocariosa]QXT29945.1 isochorismate synthase [Rothia dentocariosa]